MMNQNEKDYLNFTVALDVLLMFGLCNSKAADLIREIGMQACWDAMLPCQDNTGELMNHYYETLHYKMGIMGRRRILMEDDEYKDVIQEMKDKLLSVLTDEQREAIEFDEPTFTEEETKKMLDRYRFDEEREMKNGKL